jgi:hypothetical protein
MGFLVQENKKLYSMRRVWNAGRTDIASLLEVIVRTEFLQLFDKL